MNVAWWALQPVLTLTSLYFGWAIDLTLFVVPTNLFLYGATFKRSLTTNSALVAPTSTRSSGGPNQFTRIQDFSENFEKTGNSSAPSRPFISRTKHGRAIDRMDLKRALKICQE